MTYKVFGPHSRVVAVRPTGNVYALEAVEDLCLRPKRYKDLLTDEPFEGRKDLIVLQDPTDPAILQRRDVTRFHYTSQSDEASSGGAEAAGGADDRGATGTPALQTPKVGFVRAASIANVAAGFPWVRVLSVLICCGESFFVQVRLSHASKRLLEEVTGREEERRREADAAGVRYMSAKLARRGERVRDVGGLYGRSTTGAVSGSFTSTAVDVETEQRLAERSQADIDEERWRRVRRRGEKGYVRLVTNCGNLNLELHVDMVPRTCENFLGLCRRKFYDGIRFHRSIKNFMVQGGDPQGDGSGGESFWGKEPFRDEFDSRLRHDGRGVVSMANSGPHSNTSQFFITYRSCPHLDNKHSVFGRYVLS